MSRGVDAVVVGAGVIGLAIAWRAAQAGLTVAVCDDRPCWGASFAAAGMLAPVTEAHHGEEPLLALNLASASRWPSFATELDGSDGSAIGYRSDGTLTVGFDADDARALDDLFRFQQRLGLAVERLPGRACRELEPLLHPRVRGGVLAPGDHQVDNRRLCRALTDAAVRAGARLIRRRVAEVLPGHGVRLDDGTELAGGTVILAAGCWSSQLPGLPASCVPPVRPVKGQILRLRRAWDRPFPHRTVRGLARGRSVYVVPRGDGEVVVGATVEEQGHRTTVTAGAVSELLQAAIDLVPAAAELELVETTAGLRPGTPDNAPVLGPTPCPGVVLATGHFRNGILLAPVTADAITELLLHGSLPPVAAPFTLARFAA